MQRGIISLTKPELESLAGILPITANPKITALFELGLQSTDQVVKLELSREDAESVLDSIPGVQLTEGTPLQTARQIFQDFLNSL